ncbi:hypothetical protein CLOM_g18959 [Closterium sp. NIES-68]|nr:hypothetical protein CLOM_g18959 [Closterium sp. NIES-68]GJP78387.1 hypothetical protein CLOP_g8692 [Closterium sp. NIES-67]
MGMALCRRAVLGSAFPRPSAIRAAAARLSASPRLFSSARDGFLLPSPRRIPPPASRVALVSAAAAPPRHIHTPSSARSFRASLCGARALAGIGGGNTQLLSAARSGDRGAGSGAIRGVANCAGKGAGDAQLRSAEGKDGAGVVRSSAAPGGAEGGSEGRGKGRGGKKSRSSYGAEHIQVLEGLEPVRRRPGMYIGSTGPRGLHHLVYEVVDNAIDEAQAGHATTVEVLLGADGSVCVTDNGRGIPTDIHPSTGKSALETVLTVLHAGGKFGGDSSGYRVSGGLHGVGVSVVNALSQWLEAHVWRDGRQYSQRFERGISVGGMRVEEVAGAGVDEGEAQRTGTQIHFLPDPTVFTTTTSFDFTTIAARLRELAFLNPQVVIHLTEEAGRSVEFHFAGGLLEFVRWLNSEKAPMHDPQSVEMERDGVGVAIAWQWCSDAYSDNVVGYANSIRTSDGGTHIDGTKAAFTRTLNAAARKQRLLKEKEENLAGEHLREGLTCVVAVKVGNPEFEGQTKTRLGNPGVRRIVDAVVSEALTEFLDKNPAACEAILSKALDAYKAAEAAKKARELVRRKSVLKSAMLPGKLADCSCEDPAKSEVFIVEGDSAGGSTKQGRDRRFQAVLPLRGKILNVERKDDAAIYKNQELQNLILGLGLGLRGEEFDQRALRYHRIILLTDADVDGGHIRTLLLTFLFRYQRALFENGHVFVGVPPLYKVELARHAPVYCYTEAELQAHLRSLPASASPTLQRFKGLGEMMPVQLWETTLDPSQRRLKLITVEEAAQASVTLSVLMGDKVGPRKELIQTVGSKMAAAGMLDI